MIDEKNIEKIEEIMIAVLKQNYEAIESGEGRFLKNSIGVNHLKEIIFSEAINQGFDDGIKSTIQLVIDKGLDSKTYISFQSTGCNDDGYRIAVSRNIF